MREKHALACFHEENLHDGSPFSLPWPIIATIFSYLDPYTDEPFLEILHPLIAKILERYRFQIGKLIRVKAPDIHVGDILTFSNLSKFVFNWEHQQFGERGTMIAYLGRLFGPVKEVHFVNSSNYDNPEREEHELCLIKYLIIEWANLCLKERKSIDDLSLKKFCINNYSINMKWMRFMVTKKNLLKDRFKIHASNCEIRVARPFIRNWFNGIFYLNT